MIVYGRASRWLFRFILIGTFLLIINKTAFAEEPPQSKIYPFRLGVGLGVPYGVLGFNLSFRVNDLVEASGGYGSAGDGFKGWAVGGRIYPFPELKRFRPRLAAFYGVIGRVTTTTDNTKRTIDVFEGFALGGGFEWKFFSRHSLDLDLFYATGEPPAKYGFENDRFFIISFGYGYHF
ncbi:hypothetical protein [Candidatus Manganitrophus noduliformans]|uniref:Outer membrane protein beta-barrel domain-containing protein n=1 Tax=Candidatus Manganitrophus noduliformans TaxID=2606439 RepID=A0A7X6DMH7_9BACT|nr:hypothetical protein [Candidatus Manganitrophus noduliformans]NKE69827.1 hypothetical protein [Candidatus Manganitrophus noduliformans]